MKTWQGNAKRALDGIQWPKIDSESDLFKGAAMLNFGFDKTKRLFPKADATTLITELTTGLAKRFAVPVFILGKVQEAFSAAHQASVNRANQQLSERFEALRDQFVKKIQETADGFSDSEVGRTIADQIYPYVQNSDFKDAHQASAFLRAVMRIKIISSGMHGAWK